MTPDCKPTKEEMRQGGRVAALVRKIVGMMA
jgi:hypothetical protein